jgi:hypothetical protein
LTLLVIHIDVYFDAAHGVTSRYPFDTEAVQRKAAEAFYKRYGTPTEP